MATGERVAGRWRLEPLSTPSSWERWVDAVFAWIPYVLLAVSLALAQLESRSGSDRLLTLGLTAMAAVWTWTTFTRAGRPTGVPQGTLRLYIVGFLVFADQRRVVIEFQVAQKRVDRVALGAIRRAETHPAAYR